MNDQFNGESDVEKKRLSANKSYLPQRERKKKTSSSFKEREEEEQEEK